MQSYKCDHSDIIMLHFAVSFKGNFIIYKGLNRDKKSRYLLYKIIFSREKLFVKCKGNGRGKARVVAHHADRLILFQLQTLLF